MPNRTFRRSVVFTLWISWAVLFSACSTLHPRHPVPSESANIAEPPGYHQIRDWGDHFSPVLQQSVVVALQKESEPDNPFGKTPVQYLSLSGGGMNGAFGAGFLCGWSQEGSRPTFDFVTGVSAGALLAPFAFIGTAQDPVLREIYSTLSPKDLFKRKGLLRIIRDDSVLDTAPLRQLLEKRITPELMEQIAREHERGRRLWIGTANLDAHRPVIWDMGKIAATRLPEGRNLFIQIMMASSAVPGAFPPMYVAVEADGHAYDELHVDGGVGRQVFAYGPVLHMDEVRRTLNDLGRERPAELFVIRNGDLGSHYDPVKPRALNIVLESLNTLTHHQAEGDFYRMYLFAEHDKCNFNLTGIPVEYVRKSKIEFDPQEMRRLFDLGESMGKTGRCWIHTPWDELQLPPGVLPTSNPKP